MNTNSYMEHMQWSIFWSPIEGYRFTPGTLDSPKHLYYQAMCPAPIASSYHRNRRLIGNRLLFQSVTTTLSRITTAPTNEETIGTVTRMTGDFADRNLSPSLPELPPHRADMRARFTTTAPQESPLAGDKWSTSRRNGRSRGEPGAANMARRTRRGEHSAANTADMIGVWGQDDPLVLLVDEYLLWW